jgi:hypothetical protein
MKKPTIVGRLKVYCHRYGVATPSELEHNVPEKYCMDSTQTGTLV